MPENDKNNNSSGTGTAFSRQTLASIKKDKEWQYDFYLP
jgi:hypothetical protein